MIPIPMKPGLFPSIGLASARGPTIFLTGSILTKLTIGTIARPLKSKTTGFRLPGNLRIVATLPAVIILRNPANLRGSVDGDRPIEVPGCQSAGGRRGAGRLRGKLLFGPSSLLARTRPHTAHLAPPNPEVPIWFMSIIAPIWLVDIG